MVLNVAHFDRATQLGRAAIELERVGLMLTRYRSFALAFLSAARRILLGSSARVTEHCGWTPPREYERLPQTGQIFPFWSAVVGVDFFPLMAWLSVNFFGRGLMLTG